MAAMASFSVHPPATPKVRVLFSEEPEPPPPPQPTTKAATVKATTNTNNLLTIFFDPTFI